VTARLKQLLVVLLILLGTTTGATSWDAPVVSAGPSASTQDTASERHAVLRVSATAPQPSAPVTWWAVQPPSADLAPTHRSACVQRADHTHSAVSLPTSQSTRAPPAA
jgi:hypothetical protein